MIDRDDRETASSEPERSAAPRAEPNDLGSFLSDPEQPASPGTDRRKTERRSIDALRAEVQRTLIPEDERAVRPVPKPRVQRGSGNSRVRVVVLLLIALGAGGAAAYLALGRPQDQQVPQTATATAPAPVVEVAKTKILVAKQAIGLGQRINASLVEWQEWPESAVRPEYITVAATPEAITDMAGAVARFEFVAGEPIQEKKLVRTDAGYLSAVLDSGKRGVSVSIGAESASGGFIVPNDHVDVVMTRVTADGQQSETILHNVRVLAIGPRLGETGTTGATATPDDPQATVFVNTAIATLELDPTQAEVIIDAGVAGKLSLVLRSMVDTGEVVASAKGPANAAIRLTSPFWAK